MRQAGRILTALLLGFLAGGSSLELASPGPAVAAVIARNSGKRSIIAETDGRRRSATAELAMLVSAPFSWPPDVEQSTGATCRVAVAPIADRCRGLEAIPGTALEWQACAEISWEDGSNAVAQVAHGGRSKVIKACDRFMGSYEKRVAKKKGQRLI